MQDFRCAKCSKLLARISGEAVVAVKCPRCKELNTIQHKNAMSVKSLEDPESHITGDTDDKPKPTPITP